MGFFTQAFNGLQEFLTTGGIVLYGIMIVAFFMFMFVMERFAYYSMAHKAYTTSLTNAWNARDDRSSWKAHAVRDEYISLVKSKTTTNVTIIKTLVAIAPLLGLLGTVTGMIEVFDTMALSGSSNAKAMAGGVFKATIPTMAGMTIALVGLFCSILVEWLSRRGTKNFVSTLKIS